MYGESCHTIAGSCTDIDAFDKISSNDNYGIEFEYCTMTFEVHIKRYIDLDFPHQKLDVKLNCKKIITSPGSNAKCKKS